MVTYILTICCSKGHNHPKKSKEKSKYQGVFPIKPLLFEKVVSTTGLKILKMDLRTTNL